jgi:hypothetical protein
MIKVFKFGEEKKHIKNKKIFRHLIHVSLAAGQHVLQQLSQHWDQGGEHVHLPGDLRQGGHHRLASSTRGMGSRRTETETPTITGKRPSPSLRLSLYSI